MLSGGLTTNHTSTHFHLFIFSPLLTLVLLHKSSFTLFLWSLPVSYDQWRCPCWTAPALRTRRRCCCGLMGWLQGHHWTGRTHCWAASGVMSLAALHVLTSGSPYVGDTAPRDYRRWWWSPNHHKCRDLFLTQAPWKVYLSSFHAHNNSFMYVMCLSLLLGAEFCKCIL